MIYYSLEEDKEEIKNNVFFILAGYYVVTNFNLFEARHHNSSIISPNSR